jgi:hypothetical protein
MDKDQEKMENMAPNMYKGRKKELLQVVFDKIEPWKEFFDQMPDDYKRELIKEYL